MTIVSTYYINPDGSVAFTREDSEVGYAETGGEVAVDAVESTLAEYDARIVEIGDEADVYVAEVVADAAVVQAAADAARATVLAALATASGLTVEEIEAALA